jgi:hypothetical protein
MAKEMIRHILEAEFLYHQILMKNMSEFSEETINPYAGRQSIFSSGIAVHNLMLRRLTSSKCKTIRSIVFKYFSPFYFYKVFHGKKENRL